MTTETLQKRINERAEKRLTKEIDAALDGLAEVLKRRDLWYVTPRNDSGVPLSLGEKNAEFRLTYHAIRSTLRAQLHDVYIKEETDRFLEEFEELKDRMIELEGIERGG